MAISGGLDSSVLLDWMKEMAGPCRLSLFVAYIHHGPSPSSKTLEDYREKAREFVASESQKAGLEFLSPAPPALPLKNEREFREFRQSCLKALLKEKGAFACTLAHNREDQLETRLIRLIRGCGEEGLKGMSVFSPPWLRPLLSFSRSEILACARKRKLKWLEDPSNQDQSYLRNWLRQKWLADLEKTRTGACRSLARSLDILSESLETKALDFSTFIDVRSQGGGIKRALLNELAEKDQKRLLAFYMRQLQIPNYSLSHIEEILKQLNRREKNFTHKVLKKTWFFTEDFISAR